MHRCRCQFSVCRGDALVGLKSLDGLLCFFAHDAIYIARIVANAYEDALGFKDISAVGAVVGDFCRLDDSLAGAAGYDVRRP